MTNFITLKSDVAVALVRTDLTSTIEKEINAAIKDYSKTRFWFNETRSETFTTVIDQEFYGAAANPDIPNMVRIDDVFVYQNNTPSRLTRRDNSELEWLSSSIVSSGLPIDYCFIEKQIRIYPRPNAAYPMRVTGFVIPPNLVADADTNVFTENAFDLIKFSTLRRVLRFPMRNFEAAAEAAADEQRHLSLLKQETILRASYTRIEPTQF